MRTARHIVQRVANGNASRVADDLIVEEPLQIQLDDVLVATTMRTPGHDYELAAGFCHTDGLLGDATIKTIRYCGTGLPVESEFNIVSVETDGLAPEPTPRIGTVSSSCGICGSEAIDAMRERLRPLRGTTAFDLDVLAKIPQVVQRSQELFDRTGGVHAAAAFTEAGEPVVVREDIGRHNAVDKVIGRLLLDGELPAQQTRSFRERTSVL